MEAKEKTQQRKGQGKDGVAEFDEGEIFSHNSITMASQKSLHKILIVQAFSYAETPDYCFAAPAGAAAAGSGVTSPLM